MPLLIGVVIGLVLGLTGAGGSIFAVPLLILLLSLPVNEAVGIALGAVSISALYGTVNNWRYKSILWVPAIILGVCGTLLAPLGKWLGNQLSPAVLLSAFSALAIVIALRMWQQTIKHPEQARVVRSGKISSDDFVEPVCRISRGGQFKWHLPCVASLLVGGLLLGLLTGLFGVGGGFLIVPLLLFLTQVSMQQAVGTSLFIIAVVSGAGFISYAATSTNLDWQLLIWLAAGGLLGMLVGNLVGHKIAGPQLQKVFAISLVVVAVFTLINQLL